MKFDEIRRKLLDDLRQRRDVLNKAINDLEYELEHPLPPIHIDFKAIEAESKRNMEFLERCKQKREATE